MSSELDNLYQFGMQLLNSGNTRKAQQVLYEAANNGHVQSQFELGRLYVNGAPSKGDQTYQAGISWLQQAAQNNHPEAMKMLGIEPKTTTSSSKAAEHTSSDHFNGNRLIYAVVCQVQPEDGWGNNMQGIGSFPLTIIENTETGDQIGFAGSGTLLEVKSFLNRGNVRGEYIESLGLADFNNSTGLNVEESYLNELISASLDKDGSDFEYENNTSLTILDGEAEILNDGSLESHASKYGIWTMFRDGLDITYDEIKKELTINGEKCDNLGSAIETYLWANGYMSAALIDSVQNGQEDPAEIKNKLRKQVSELSTPSDVAYQVEDLICEASELNDTDLVEIIYSKCEKLVANNYKANIALWTCLALFLNKKEEAYSLFQSKPLDDPEEFDDVYSDASRLLEICDCPAEEIDNLKRDAEAMFDEDGNFQKNWLNKL